MITLTLTPAYRIATLHPYLQQALQRNALTPRTAQLAALRTFQEGKHLLVNEAEGAGKTLAYLLPVINRILHTKQHSFPLSGAVILTLNKELALNIYRAIRTLDFDNILSVGRSGSITHYGPVIDEMCKKKEEQDQDLIADLMEKNVAKSVTWPHTDILVTTPPLLYKILSQKEEDKEPFSPQMVVIDEADLLLGKEELYNYFRKDINFINKLSPHQDKRRYLLSSPTHNALPFTKKLPALAHHLESTNYSETRSIISTLAIRYVKNQKDCPPEEQFNHRLAALVRVMASRVGKRVVIYCGSKAIQPIRTTLKTKLDLTCGEYYARMSSQKRMAALFDFNFGRTKILLTTDLANRYPFQQPIDCIVSFQPCESSAEEAVRIGRSTKEGGEYVVLGDFSLGLQQLRGEVGIGKYLRGVAACQLEG